jgi:hypothetical protein
VPHIVVPLAQLEAQVVPLQTWFAPQAVPQVPQLVASLGRHPLLQSSWLDWHVHWPP